MAQVCNNKKRKEEEDEEDGSEGEDDGEEVKTKRAKKLSNIIYGKKLGELGDVIELDVNTATLQTKEEITRENVAYFRTLLRWKFGIVVE